MILKLSRWKEWLVTMKEERKAISLGKLIKGALSWWVPRLVWRDRMRTCRKCAIFDRETRRCRGPKQTGCGCYVPFLAATKAPYEGQGGAGCWGRALMGGSFGWGSNYERETRMNEERRWWSMQVRPACGKLLEGLNNLSATIASERSEFMKTFILREHERAKVAEKEAAEKATLTSIPLYPPPITPAQFAAMASTEDIHANLLRRRSIFYPYPEGKTADQILAAQPPLVPPDRLDAILARVYETKATKPKPYAMGADGLAMRARLRPSLAPVPAELMAIYLEGKRAELKAAISSTKSNP